MPWLLRRVRAAATTQPPVAHSLPLALPAPALRCAAQVLLRWRDTFTDMSPDVQDLLFNGSKAWKNGTDPCGWEFVTCGKVKRRRRVTQM